MNQIFTLDQFGLRSVLLDIGVVASMVAQLGSGRSLVRFNPFFSNNTKNDNGLFAFSMLVAFIGYCVIAILLLLVKQNVIDYFQEDSPLIDEFYWAVFPLIFLMLANSLFESKLQSRINTAFAAFLKEIIGKLLITLILVLFHFQVIDYFQFIVGFLLTYVLNTSLFVFYLFNNDLFSLKINWKFFNSRLRKIYLRYSFFSVFTNMSGILLTKLDTIMLLFLMGLGAAGIYANAMYLSILIVIPAYSIVKISFPILADNYRRKNMDDILDLYKKSSLNQFLIGGVLFVLLWSNIENVFAMQKTDYAEGKYVLLILCSARLIDMLTGVNGQIINVSRYYPFEGIASSILTLLAVCTNLLLIPIYGINGAAIATAISLFTFNIGRTYFVYLKMGLQPFDKNTLKAILVVVVGFIVGYLIPTLENIYLDLLIRSFILAAIMGALILKMNISQDINRLFSKYSKKFNS